MGRINAKMTKSKNFFRDTRKQMKIKEKMSIQVDDTMPKPGYTLLGRRRMDNTAFQLGANGKPKQYLRTKVLRTSCAQKIKLRQYYEFFINFKQFQYNTLYFKIIQFYLHLNYVNILVSVILIHQESLLE
ncbi:Hypothetical_protein [Hexamita inflata]|uniref:Hypothetical_protein n=1 Tax=Hexamita inflata TaxID=28002 RepID=A0AA86TDG3_9EUKA|nr:Hypothetical protein HINF_LOCUS2430 [Hexamita inflata]